MRQSHVFELGFPSGNITVAVNATDIETAKDQRDFHLHRHGLRMLSGTNRVVVTPVSKFLPANVSCSLEGDKEVTMKKIDILESEARSRDEDASITEQNIESLSREIVALEKRKVTQIKAAKTYRQEARGIREKVKSLREPLAV
jgi:hypothetical protein